MKGRNCPNCGAVFDERNIKCQYCGTLYYDLSTMPVGEPFFLTIKDGDKIIYMDAAIRGEQVTDEALLNGKPGAVLDKMLAALRDEVSHW